jgi:hypothetical protein
MTRRLACRISTAQTSLRQATQGRVMGATVTNAKRAVNTQARLQFRIDGAETVNMVPGLLYEANSADTAD